MTAKYTLVDGKPRLEPDVMKWAVWMEGADEERVVAADAVGGSRVSTTFLALDHNFAGGPPLLWETMVFGGPLDGEQERYTSRDDALAGHRRWVEHVKDDAR